MALDEYDAFKRDLRRALESLRIRPPLSPGAIDTLVGAAQRLEETRGRTIFGPDDTHHFSYVLLAGRVRLECRDHRGRARVIQVIRPGRLFGIEWLPAKRREVRAVADTDVTAALITHEAVHRVVAGLSHEQRLGLMSFVWRTLSALVVAKAGVRTLPLKQRVAEALHSEAAAADEPAGCGGRVVVRIAGESLAARVGATSCAVRHALRALRRDGVIEGTSPHLRLLPASSTVAPTTDAPAFAGVDASWARPKLRELLERCRHLDLNRAAKDIIGRSAALFAVPAGAVLLPPRAEDGVAFIVSGSAWLEGMGPTGATFTLQLLPVGQFVRLPTGPSSRRRLWGRAHRDSIVALLTIDQMKEVIGAMTSDGALLLLDSTCRNLSRHLCDSTTAPTRALPCRLFHTLLFLAHDFPGRDLLINEPLTLSDLGRLVDAGHPAVAKALGRLMGEGWVERVAPQRYRLRQLPPRQTGQRWPCPICRGPARRPIPTRPDGGNTAAHPVKGRPVADRRDDRGVVDL